MEKVSSLPLLPGRAADAHKGDFGRLAVVAGSPGMTGAAALAARAAMRTGSGLVTVACPRPLNSVLEVKLTEAMTLPVEPGPAGGLGLDACGPIMELAVSCDCVAVGPGVGREAETQELMRLLVAEIDAPVVLDADGLFAFGALETDLSAREAPLVVTPHAGEAARLLGTDALQVQADREGSAAALAEATGGVAVLKGAGTVVTDGERMYVNTTGNPGMASGGTGDVLTGMIASLIGQGLAPFEAASLGAYLHGLAGDIAAERVGRASLIASDVIAALPEALKRHGQG